MLVVGTCWMLFIAAGLTGCRPFQHDSDVPSPLRLPASRLAPDAVGLEVGVAQLDVDQRGTFEQFWAELDAQKISLEDRKRLDQNGLRAAVMSSRPPAMLPDLVNPRPIVLDELNEFQRQLYIKRFLKPESRMVQHARISNRSGQRHPVPISEYHSAFSWTIQADGKQTIGSGQQVRGVMTVTTFPQGDGSVRLVITPEIHHGEPQHRIGSADHGFKFETRQNIDRIKQLSFEVVLRSGESVVVAPTADLDSLGQLFFGQANSSDESLGLSMESELPAVDRIEKADLAAIEEVEEDELDLLGRSEATVARNLETIDNMLAEELTIGGKAKLARPDPLHRVFMIRVVQTQLDDLFTDVEEIEPLTSVNRY